MQNRPISDFISEIKQEGLARTNRFSVEIFPPSSVQARAGWAANIRRVLLFCDTAQLPGINLSTTQSRTYGEFREIPYEKLFDNINLTFYMDTSMHVKSLFDNWMKAVQDPETREFSYYADYTCRLNIYIFDVKDQARYKVTLHEAYPKTVSAISLDQAAKDVMKLNVGVVYKNYTVEQLVAPDNEPMKDVSTPWGFLENKLGLPLPSAASLGIPTDYFNDFGNFQGMYNDFGRMFDGISDRDVGTSVVREDVISPF